MVNVWVELSEVSLNNEKSKYMISNKNRKLITIEHSIAYVVVIFDQFAKPNVFLVSKHLKYWGGRRWLFIGAVSSIASPEEMRCKMRRWILEVIDLSILIFCIVWEMCIL